MPNLPLFIPSEADGWLITEHVIREMGKREYMFVGFLANNLPSELILAIAQQVAKSKLKVGDKHSDGTNNDDVTVAVYLYLNDGTQYQNHIVAGTANIEARKIYYSRIARNEKNEQILTWSEPAVIVLNGERELDFWQTWSMALPLTKGL